MNVVFANVYSLQEPGVQLPTCFCNNPEKDPSIRCPCDKNNQFAAGAVPLPFTRAAPSAAGIATCSSLSSVAQRIHRPEVTKGSGETPHTKTKREVPKIGTEIHWEVLVAPTCCMCSALTGIRLFFTLVHLFASVSCPQQHLFLFFLCFPFLLIISWSKPHVDLMLVHI